MKWVLCMLACASQLDAAEIGWESLPERAAKAPMSQAGLARVEAANETMRTWSRSLHPRVGAFAGAGGASDATRSEAGVEAGLSLRWNLWRAGLDRAEESWREASLATAGAEAKSAELALLYEVRLAWLEAWDLHGRSLAIKRALERAQYDIKAARQKAFAGLTPPSEVDEQELRASQLDHHAHLDEQARDLALARLAGMLGLSEARLPESVDLGWPRMDEAAHGPGPAELRAKARLELAWKTRNRAPSWLKPSLDLDGDWGREARRLPLEDARFSGGLRLSAELWDGGIASAQRSVFDLEIRAAALELEAAVALESALRKAAGDDVRRWLEHKPHLEERMALAARIREKVIQEYRRGVRDGRDLSGSSMDLLEVEEEWAEDRAIAWKSWAKFEALKAFK